MTSNSNSPLNTTAGVEIDPSLYHYMFHEVFAPRVQDNTFSAYGTALMTHNTATSRGMKKEKILKEMDDGSQEIVAVDFGIVADFQCRSVEYEVSLQVVSYRRQKGIFLCFCRTFNLHCPRYFTNSRISGT
jgi:hypothetical protein